MKTKNSLKKLLCLLMALSASVVMFNSCDKGDEPGGSGNGNGNNPGIGAPTPTTDPGVVINGIRWATRNVDVPNTFAPTAESFGKFYQWNCKFPWQEQNIDDSSTWYVNLPKGNPIPEGWRLATFEEVESLLDTDKVTYQWTTQNGIKGGKFTDKATSNSIFLPAVGYADYPPTQGVSGWYWFGERGGQVASATLHFDSSGAYGWSVSNANGHSIRPVAW